MSDSDCVVVKLRLGYNSVRGIVLSTLKLSEERKKEVKVFILSDI